MCFNYRFYPLMIELRRMLGSGRYGPVHLVHGGYLQDWLLRASDWNWRLDPGRAGPSRAVADIGSHWIDLIQFLTADRVSAVAAQLGRLHATRFRPRDRVQTFARSTEGGDPYQVVTEDFANVLLRFASGAQGSFGVSQVSAGRKNHLHVGIDAADASFAWDQEEPNVLWVGRRDLPNEQILQDPAQMSTEAARFARLPAGHQEGWLDTLRGLFEDFYAAITTFGRAGVHSPSFATFGDAHQVTRVVEAILVSDREKSWRDVASEGVIAT